MPMRAYGILQPPTRHQQQEYLGAAVGAVPRLVQTGMPMPCMHARPSHRPRVQGASERDTPETRHESPTARSVAVLVVRSSRASIRVSGRRARGADAAEGGWMGESAAAAAGKTRRQTRDACAAANGTGLAAACACAAAHTLRLGEARVCGHAANLECAPQAKAGWLQRHRMGDGGGGGGGEARQFVDCLFFLSCLLLVVEAVDGDGARIAVTTTSTTTTISVSPIHPSSPCLALPRRSRNLSDAVQDASPLLQTTIQPTHAPPE